MYMVVVGVLDLEVSVGQESRTSYSTRLEAQLVDHGDCQAFSLLRKRPLASLASAFLTVDPRKPNDRYRIEGPRLAQPGHEA